MTRRAQITIYADDEFETNYQFQGDTKMITTLIGSLEMAKQWLMGSLENVNVTDKGALPPNEISAYTETTLTRDKAIAAYRYAQAAMEERIKTMEKSDPTQTFLVDHSLLSKL